MSLKEPVETPSPVENIHNVVNGVAALKLKSKKANKKVKSKRRNKISNANDSIPYHTFNHSSKNYLPNDPKRIFKSIEEVGLFKDDQFTCDVSQKRKLTAMPVLVHNASLLADLSITDSKALKTKFIGTNLYDNLEIYKAMDDKDLDSIEPCLKYIESQFQCGAWLSAFPKLTIVSARHHIVDIGMSLFNSNEKNADTTLICTYLDNGLLLFSQDTQNKSFAKDGIYSTDPILKKICFSGFAFEDLITNQDGPKSPAFSIVKARLDDNIDLVLRCEMDAYNATQDIYSELKCYANLKMGNPQHRKKLLKTWLQTGICPESDIIIGIRNPSDGILHDILQYSRTNLYRKFNSRNLTPYNKDFNYNSNVAVEWLQHCLRSICELVRRNANPDVDEGPRSFKIKIDARHNIHVKKLHSTPVSVTIPNFT
ncbi:similar to Saccharomyces cerevisiae YDR370C DXO1 Putative protein of unknown function [Maudiozyma saulgeensis]|uniref:Decapping nuclease n=1 Tax=Maudiozyma saulgeensis TaxID=1789683 RepID=A0A1X7R2J4_9SACH|nr:similar to Saccharomyces cerevisiae YDR370C DXO1 Putative protein of unknown function [Kazachstania saulgeensis]